MTFYKNILFREWGEVIVASYSENVMQSTVKLFCSFLDLFFMKLVSQAVVSNIFVFFNFFLPYMNYMHLSILHLNDKNTQQAEEEYRLYLELIFRKCLLSASVTSYSGFVLLVSYWEFIFFFWNLMTLNTLIALFSFRSLCKQCGTYVEAYQKYLLLSFFRHLGKAYLQSIFNIF